MNPTLAPVTRWPRSLTLLAALAAIAALHLGRGILAPLALAGLLAFLLAPLAGFIERLRVGRGIAAVVSVLLLMSVVAGPLVAVAHEVIALSRELPTYRGNIQRKLSLLRGASLAEPLREAIQERPNAPEPGASSVRAPMRVAVVEPERGALDALVGIAGPLAPYLAGTIILLLVTTLLITCRSEVRERFVRLVGRGELADTVHALDDASRRMGRFLASSLLVNALFAVPTIVGLMVIGVPNAVLWGVLAGLLRFVPLVGIWIGALFPLATAFAVYDDWWRTGAILAIFGLADLLVSNVAEPLIYSRRTGVAPFAVVLSTLFWTWLWGVTGLFLAMPLTVCLAVAGQHVPGMGFLAVLLGSAPALSRAQRFYQHLLSFDPAGARRQLEQAIQELGVDAGLDQTVMPALALASADRRRGALDQEAFHLLCTSARDLVDALEPALAAPAAPASGPPPAVPAVSAGPHAAGQDPASSPHAGLPPVLIVPVADAADAAAADILAARLTTLGITSQVSAVSSLGGEIAAMVERLVPPLVVLVGLPPLAEGRVRYLGKRLRGCVPAGRLLGLAWEPGGAQGPIAPGQSEAADQTLRDLEHAVPRIGSLLNEARQRHALAEPASPRPRPLLAQEAS